MASTGMPNFMYATGFKPAYLKGFTSGFDSSDQEFKSKFMIKSDNLFTLRRSMVFSDEELARMAEEWDIGWEDGAAAWASVKDTAKPPMEVM